MFEGVQVAAEDGGRHWRIQWRRAPGGAVTLCGGMHPDGIDHSRPLGQTKGRALRVAMADGIYFCLEADGARHTVGPRRLPFSMAPNFRELGGYPLGSGHRLRWGCLYRSGHLANLDDGDAALLAALRIGMVIDFRHDNEVQSQPHRLPTPPPQLAALPITPGSHCWDTDGKVEIGSEDVARKMCEINRDLAIGQSEHYRSMFRQLLSPRRGAALLNCTAGKDRTGFGAALVLLALGATRETVMADYLLSAEFLLGAQANLRNVLGRDGLNVLGRYGLDDTAIEAWRPILTVRREYLQHAFDAIDEHHASTEEYLELRLGVDAAARAALRERFAE